MAFTLRTDPELEQALADLAAAQGVSKQEVIRRAVLEKHAQQSREERLVSAVDHMLERWGDVLDRLGSV